MKYPYPINPYMDTSVCRRSGNVITVCKYGKSNCHGKLGGVKVSDQFLGRGI